MSDDGMTQAQWLACEYRKKISTLRYKGESYARYPLNVCHECRYLYDCVEKVRQDG